MKKVPPVVWVLGAGAVLFILFRSKIADALNPASDRNLVYSSGPGSVVETILDKIGPGAGTDTRPTIVAGTQRADGTWTCPAGYTGKFYGANHPKAGQAYCLLNK